MSKSLYDIKYNKVLSERLISLREGNRYTIEAVSQYLKINRNTYYCYEKGTRDCPMSVFVNLCNFYHLDYVDVFKEIHEQVQKELHENKV